MRGVSARASRYASRAPARATAAAASGSASSQAARLGTPTIGMPQAEREPLGEGHRHPQAGERAGTGAHRDGRRVAERAVRAARSAEQARQQLGRLPLRAAPGVVGEQRAVGLGEREREVGRGAVDGDDHAAAAPRPPARSCAAPWAAQRRRRRIGASGGRFEMDLEPFGRQPAVEPIGPLDDRHAIGLALVEQPGRRRLLGVARGDRRRRGRAADGRRARS